MEEEMGKPEVLTIKSTDRPLTGITTVTTAGTAVVLAADQPCSRVYVEAYEDNTNTVVIGDVNVVAAVATRRGRSLFQTQGDWFNVRNLNQIFVDAIANGDKVSWYAEV